MKREEKKKWENPNTFLEQGPHGPYFMLHNFKTTEPLDVDKLNTLKVAGLLKYKVKLPKLKTILYVRRSTIL